jgi:hypothetical protein
VGWDTVKPTERWVADYSSSQLSIIASVRFHSVF